MSTLTYALSDSAAMFRRELRHTVRYPVMTISGIIAPTFILVLFVYVFGGAMGAGLGGTLSGGATYIDYVLPGVLVMAIGSGAATTAVNINSDMNEGIIARFRTMSIARSSVLAGQVLGSLLRTMASVLLLVGVGLLLGFRPAANAAEWISVVGVVAMLAFAYTWLAVAIGMAAKTPAGANSATLPLQFGPFISSAFVNPDSMPAGWAWIAENQPFTPIIDTLRGLLLGAPTGNSWLFAIGWCVAIALFGYAWARAVYNRMPAH
jgi:ABC-2 type transport system permease protein